MTAEDLFSQALEVWNNFISLEMTYWGFTFSWRDVLVGIFILSIVIYFVSSSLE